MARTSVCCVETHLDDFLARRNTLTLLTCRHALYKDCLGMNEKRPDLVQGTLDLLVLNTLRHGPLHGYGIAQKILATSRNVLEVQQGSLYPALHRLERKGLVKGEWKESGNGRMAKIYALTAAGKKQLGAELEDWKRYTDAISWVLES